MNFKLKNKWAILLVLALTALSKPASGQDRAQKTDTIIDCLNIIEPRKMVYSGFLSEALWTEANAQDSVKLAQIKDLLTDEEIRRRIVRGFDSAFTDNEINDIYGFIKTTASDKLLKSVLANAISEQFKDIEEKIYEIAQNTETERDNKYQPIPVEREDGFYEVINYDSNMETKEFELEEHPSIIKDCIEEISKEINKYSGEPTINIILNEDGAEKFYTLTNKNIGKPIAIVVNKRIVFAPTVHMPIEGGRIAISGVLTNKEADEIIEKLRMK